MMCMSLVAACMSLGCDKGVKTLSSSMIHSPPSRRWGDDKWWWGQTTVASAAMDEWPWMGQYPRIQKKRECIYGCD